MRPEPRSTEDGTIILVDPTRPAATASIVIPAHNEEFAIGRLLTTLLSEADPGEFEIVVVCNGCSDGTAEVARRFSGDVRVVELAEPSKYQAMKRGDVEALVLPRVYVDADVEVGTRDIRALLAPITSGAALASGPGRNIPRDRVSWIVRAYYDVWERLPQVRTGLFGRGVIAVSAVGYQRISALPHVMSDDLAVSMAFAEHERVVVPDAHVTVHPPRTLRALVDRRIRVHTGNVQLDRAQGRASGTKTGLRELWDVARPEPALWPRLPVFLGVTVAARIAARRRVRAGDFTTWLRDDSSRGSDQP